MLDQYKNEDYDNMLKEWQQLEDCYNENIKNRTTEYLPKTSGMVKDTENGQKRYEAYLKRANYYNHIKQTVINSKNAIARKPAIINDIPESLEYLLDNFNSDNESIFSVLDDIYQEQMKLGRVGYLVDLISENGKFEAVRYKAQSILDWDFKRVEGIKTLSYVLLNEDIKEVNAIGVSETVTKQRVLGLDSLNNYFTVLLEENEDVLLGQLKANLDNMIDFLGDRVIYPVYMGKMLNHIPFKVANTDNLKMDFQQAPLVNQSNLSIGVYNADANHQALVYLQTANMLFFKGVSKTDFNKNFLGVDSIFQTEGTEADAKYIGVDGEGLLESRENLKELKIETGSFGVTVMEKTTQESEKSLQSRIELQTDKLRDVAVTGASLVQWLLTTIIEWTGQISEVTVIGNTDFRTEQETAKEFKEISEIWQSGRMTNTDYHNWQKRNSYTSLEFDDWIKEIDINRTVVNDDNTNLNDEKKED